MVQIQNVFTRFYHFQVYVSFGKMKIQATQHRNFEPPENLQPNSFSTQNLPTKQRKLHIYRSTPKHYVLNQIQNH